MALTDTGRDIARLFIDSGPSWRVSGSNSRFRYEVPGTQLTCRPGTWFSVDSVVVAHGWYPINDTDRRLYVRIRTSTNSNPVGFSDFTVLLDEGAPSFSTLASELTTKLSALGSSTLTATWNAATFAFRIVQSGTAAYGFQPFSDTMLKRYHFGGGMVQNPRSANQILGIVDVSAPSVGADVYGYSVLADYGAAILLHLHSLRIVCQALGGSTLDERGAYGTIAKLPLSEGYGELEVQRASGGSEPWLPCGGRTLKTLDFEILDEYGNEVRLPESCPISFSISFEHRES